MAYYEPELLVYEPIDLVSWKLDPPYWLNSLIGVFVEETAADASITSYSTITNLICVGIGTFSQVVICAYLVVLAVVLLTTYCWLFGRFEAYFQQMSHEFELYSYSESVEKRPLNSDIICNKRSMYRLVRESHSVLVICTITCPYALLNRRYNGSFQSVCMNDTILGSSLSCCTFCSGSFSLPFFLVSTVL